MPCIIVLGQGVHHFVPQVFLALRMVNMLDKKVKEITQAPDTVFQLTRGEIQQLLAVAARTFEREPRLIEITAEGRIVFVGDTHGDFEATKIVVEKYLDSDTKLVFLGDYVDRGRDSEANINYLLCLKLIYPGKVYLLQGNHEGYGVFQFYPANFWETLDKEVREQYEKTLLELPLVVSVGKIIGLHGVLPDIKTLSDIDEIQAGDGQWRRVVWGDWQEISGDYLGVDAYTGRPQFGEAYFERLMRRLGKNVLIRSHQPNAPQMIYGNRCLTIFTSHAYMPIRTIAVANLKREIVTADDLLIESI